VRHLNFTLIKNGRLDTQTIGIAAGICTSISLFPQLLKIIKNKKSDDISIYYLSILLAGLALWTWYGVRRDDLPVIATNCLSLLLNILMIILGLRYKNREKK
jgi:MtN3 and saliva related transmembrane protein